MNRIGREDIMPLEDYAAIRDERKAAVQELKRTRRVALGPDATVYFENYATVWLQIHEMLWIERGGETQIADELAAYSPLVPDGRELVATFMIEIPDADRRRASLSQLAGIDRTVAFRFAGTVVFGRPESDVERTDAEKTSAVHFLRFPFTPGQIEAFCAPDAAVELAVAHPEYAHATRLGADTRLALCRDFARP